MTTQWQIRGGLARPTWLGIWTSACCFSTWEKPSWFPTWCYVSFPVRIAEIRLELFHFLASLRLYFLARSVRFDMCSWSGWARLAADGLRARCSAVFVLWPVLLMCLVGGYTRLPGTASSIRLTIRDVCWHQVRWVT